MRTASEILDDHLSSFEWDDYDSQLAAMYARAKDAINEARKEAIEECAAWVIDHIDRQKILSLIKELK